MIIETVETIERIAGLNKASARRIIDALRHGKFKYAMLVVCQSNPDAMDLLELALRGYSILCKPPFISKKSSRHSILSPFIEAESSENEISKKSEEYTVVATDLHYPLFHFIEKTIKYAEILLVTEDFIKVKEKTSDKIFHLELRDKKFQGKTLAEIANSQLNDPNLELYITDENRRPVKVLGSEIEGVMNPYGPDQDLLFLVHPRKNDRPHKTYDTSIKAHREGLQNDGDKSLKKAKFPEYKNLLPNDKEIWQTSSHGGITSKPTQSISFFASPKILEKLRLPFQHGSRLDFIMHETKAGKSFSVDQFPAIGMNEVVWLFLPDEDQTVVALEGAKEILAFMKILTTLKVYHFVAPPLWQKQMEKVDTATENQVAEQLMTIKWFKNLIENKNDDYEKVRTNYKDSIREKLSEEDIQNRGKTEPSP